MHHCSDLPAHYVTSQFHCIADLNQYPDMTENIVSACSSPHFQQWVGAKHCFHQSVC